MKIIFFLSLLVNILLAEPIKKSCYTIQLLSKPQKNSLSMDNSYPRDCKLMNIGKISTIRCGCYDKKKDIKDNLNQLKKKYKKAFITKTYKYRFKEKNRNAKNKKVHSEIDNNDGELRLILQVFLYKGDLESAYKVANLGYNKYKKSYYWNQKMAEICKWTNRSARATKHLKYIYSIKYDQKIEDELISYGAATYQYEDIEELVVNKALRNPTEENINLMILTYKKIGEPEKVVQILEDKYYKDTNNTMLLTKALKLSLEIGDILLAKKYVNIIESNKPYSQKDGALIANYYYIKHNVSKAYNSLLYVDNFNIKNKEDNIKYYELKSDLGWYLQDNLNAAIASKALIKLEHARLVDYERIIYVYKQKDPELSREMQKKAYLKYKISYLFYAYAEDALNSEEYDDLSELIKMIEEKELPLVKDSKFWIIKSKLFTQYKELDLAEKALHIAYDISPDDYSIKLVFINHYINTNNHKDLKLLLIDIGKNNKLDSSFFLPIASAYFYLNDINMASYYTNKLLALNDAVTKLINFKFMQAYISQAKNNQSAFIKLMKEIFAKLKKDAKSDKTLLTNNLYLSNYLRSAMYIVDAKLFEKKLKKAKKYLTKSNYKELTYSWALKNGSAEKSLKIFNKIKHKALWLQFSNSLLFKNHSKIQNLLSTNLKNLSSSDAAQAADKDGQQSLSQSIAFEGLSKNSYSQNAYIQHLDLSKKRSDIFDFQISRNDREPLSQNYIKIKNSIYLNKGYYFDMGAKYSVNSVSNNSFINFPKESYNTDIALKKEFDKGYLTLDIGFYSSMKDYLGLDLIGQYRLSTDLITNIILSKNREAKEGNLLLLGGKRDMLSLNLVWSVLNSTNINFLYENNSYSSQDDVFLGRGSYGKVAINYQIRNGYPDMKIGTSFDIASYSEKLGDRGVIDNLTIKKPSLLPEDFYNIGINFSYGMANSGSYTRVWRPYFELNPSYNSITKAYSYGYNIGYGGKSFHQDHLSFGLIYTTSSISKEKSIYEFYVNYKFLYKHPKL